MKCGWLSNHTSIDSTGRVRPCCTWRNTGNEPLVSDNFDNYRQSDFVKKIKNQLNLNSWPEGCEDCRLDEEANIPSMRTRGHIDYKKNPGKDAEIKFGNLCNLKCAMCSPYNSSLIAKEYEDMKSKGMSHQLIERKVPDINFWYEDESLLTKVAKQMNEMSLIKFSGGEPTINSYLSDFLRQIDNKQTQIQITTNGNNWPEKLHNEVLKFSDIKITLSLDGYGGVNEYIRYPSSWRKIQKNIEKMKEICNSATGRLVMNSTVASYNVHRLGELCDWASTMNFWEWQFHTVYNPNIFHPSNASDKMKDKFFQDMKKYKQLKVLEPNVTKKGVGLKGTKEYLGLLDKQRGTDISVLELD